VAKWLKEGTECKVAIWNDKVIQISVPTSMTLKVTETDPGVKGNTAQGVTKPATLETGAVVTVPGFINEGELIVVNTEKREYTGRGKE
jgi:elongation factor P